MCVSQFGNVRCGLVSQSKPATMDSGDPTALSNLSVHLQPHSNPTWLCFLHERFVSVYVGPIACSKQVDSMLKNTQCSRSGLGIPMHS